LGVLRKGGVPESYRGDQKGPVPSGGSSSGERVPAGGTRAGPSAERGYSQGERAKNWIENLGKGDFWGNPQGGGARDQPI